MNYAVAATLLAAERLFVPINSLQLFGTNVALGYPAVQLDEEAADVGKVKPMKKGWPFNRSCWHGNNLTFKPRGPSSARASKKAATPVDIDSNSGDNVSSNDGLSSEQSGANTPDSNSEIEPSSSEVEESEPTPDKKAGTRKPSKRVLETAMNEVSPV